jgi:NAD(P)-dependent dehydrogenase (short-subunit alcohol dehydrogenase family)
VISIWPAWGNVAAFAADRDGPLHILVNNAGIMAVPELVGLRTVQDRVHPARGGGHPQVEMFGGGVARWALDPGGAGRLWDLATGLLNAHDGGATRPAS